MRGLCTASASLSTATSGEGMSGLPNPRSMTSTPAAPCLQFQLVDLREDIRRKTLKFYEAPSPDDSPWLARTGIRAMRIASVTSSTSAANPRSPRTPPPRADTREPPPPRGDSSGAARPRWSDRGSPRCAGAPNLYPTSSRLPSPRAISRVAPAFAPTQRSIPSCSSSPKMADRDARRCPRGGNSIPKASFSARLPCHRCRSPPRGGGRRAHANETRDSTTIRGREQGRDVPRGNRFGCVRRRGGDGTEHGVHRQGGRDLSLPGQRWSKANTPSIPAPQPARDD